MTSLEVRLIRTASVNLAAVPIGALIWKTDDPAFRREMAAIVFARCSRASRADRVFVITGQLGRNIATWQFAMQQAISAERFGRDRCKSARKHPVTEELLRDQLSRLGDTPFELRSIETDLPPDAMVPKSVLNDLRRQGGDSVAFSA